MGLEYTPPKRAFHGLGWGGLAAVVIGGWLLIIYVVVTFFPEWTTLLFLSPVIIVLVVPVVIYGIFKVFEGLNYLFGSTVCEKCGKTIRNRHFETVHRSVRSYGHSTYTKMENQKSNTTYRDLQGDDFATSETTWQVPVEKTHWYEDVQITKICPACRFSTSEIQKKYRST